MNTLNKWQIPVLCGLLLAVAACGSRSAGDGNPSSSTTTAPMTASSDPRADVTKAMRASLEAKSYRSRIVTCSSNGSDRTMTAEIVAPDRMRMTMEMDIPGRGAVKRETVIIGKETTTRISRLKRQRCERALEYDERDLYSWNPKQWQADRADPPQLAPMHGLCCAF